jgi:hypothetical protein
VLENRTYPNIFEGGACTGIKNSGGCVLVGPGGGYSTPRSEGAHPALSDGDLRAPLPTTQGAQPPIFQGALLLRWNSKQQEFQFSIRVARACIYVWNLCAVLCLLVFLCHIRVSLRVYMQVTIKWKLKLNKYQTHARVCDINTWRRYSTECTRYLYTKE